MKIPGTSKIKPITQDKTFQAALGSALTPAAVTKVGVDVGAEVVVLETEDFVGATVPTSDVVSWVGVGKA